ncbi:high affinity immunoglobulin alpha and immunoglobulin mu Fc receptor isoform X2 [Nycticebus coucang]|uniref:high affinity immunoglobulin alpha and immunoglobulin mu Fc receptor isoform X2 n=1 Tax=Nycticebus coucang TaxID=9470 RepID=UPI00234D57F1|nr:high affinity immunoglobulin alpha and immunoglobulin mu Fc receptor isoform X2 [Nycticebus coucang]
MVGEAPTKVREQKVAQRARWKMSLLLILCLLQGSSLTPPHRRWLQDSYLRWLQDGSLLSGTHLRAIEMPSSPLCWQDSPLAAENALKGPRLVSGVSRGTVTVQCHYAPSSVNRHQRKYWCRLRSPRWICHTIVSTNHYTHPHYHNRVALMDFPQRGFFVVRMSQLSLDDVGCYHCGIGDGNTMLFFSINLTVSAGPSGTLPTATSPDGGLTTRSFGIAPPTANRWTPGPTQTTEGQGTEWDRVALTPGASTTASAKGRETPGTTRTARTGVRVEGPIKATVPIPESPASKTRSVSNITAGVWMWGTRNSITNRAVVSNDRRQITTTRADRPGEETEGAEIALDAAKKVIGTMRPSALVSEKLSWETLQEATPVSEQQFLGSLEGTIPAAGMWILGTTSIETASVEGSAEGTEDAATEDSGPPIAGSLRPPGKGSSRKSAFPEKKNSSRILTPVSTILVPLMLVALVLLQKKLSRRRISHESERAPRVTLIQVTHFLEPSRQADQLPHVERKMIQEDPPIAQARQTVPERDPGP